MIGALLRLPHEAVVTRMLEALRREELELSQTELGVLLFPGPERKERRLGRASIHACARGRSARQDARAWQRGPGVFQPEALARWLDAHHRRELLPGLLRGGVLVSGHSATVETPGLLTDSGALRTLLGQLAELAKLLSLR